MKTRERGTCPYCERRCYVRPFTFPDRVKRVCYAHSHIPGKAVTRPEPCPGVGEVCVEDRARPAPKGCWVIDTLTGRE